MRQPYRTAGRWTLRGSMILLLLAGVYVAALAFPRPLFAHRQSFEEFTVYSNERLPAGFAEVMADVRARVEAMEHARPGARCRVFICDNRRLYSLFASLTRKSPNTMAIGLSAFGNVFLNEPKIRRVAAQNYGGIRHSRFEGDFAEVIAHEIAHFNVVKTVGFRSAIRMPFWKGEGYAEHQANLAAVRADSSYDFRQRIDHLLDDTIWGAGGSSARTLFEWHLLVEYLCDVKGYSLHELLDPAVTESHTREQMLAWHEEQRTGD